MANRYPGWSGPLARILRRVRSVTLPSPDQVKQIKIEFWQDETAQDVNCTYQLKGWISDWHTCSG